VLEVSAEQWQLGKTHCFGNLFDTEVSPFVQERFGVRYDILVDPLWRSSASGFFDYVGQVFLS